MKLSIVCCLTLTFFAECFGQLNPNLPIINRPILRLVNRGVNNLTPVRPVPVPVVPLPNIPKKFVQFLPVPVVKKVTHHHVHHVIAHKGGSKTKFASDNGFESKDNESNSDNTFKTTKDEVFDTDLMFSKRGGRLVSASTSVTTLADLIRSTGGGKSAIRGVIGGQKAEFVPIVVGILDEDRDNVNKDKEFSSRTGLSWVRPDVKNRYLPPKETIKLFEDLARLGFK